MLKKSLLIVFLGALSLFFPTTESQGSLIEQLGISTKAMSLGNAVTAHPPGIMSVHYNPAGLTRLEGRHYTLGLGAAAFERIARFSADPDFRGFLGFEEVPDPLAGKEGVSTGGVIVLPGYGAIGLPILPVPNLGISFNEPGSRWTVAFASYAPFGGGLEHGNPDDPARFGGRGVSFQRMVMAPAVAYKISDRLSVGLSMVMGMAAMSVDMPMRIPNDLIALTHLIGEFSEPMEGFAPELFPLLGGGLHPFEEIASIELVVEDNFTTSFNLGLLWEPVDWFAFGICYQSESRAKMSGEFEFKYGQRFQNLVKWIDGCEIIRAMAKEFCLPYRPMPGQRGRVTMDFIFPQRWQLGIMLRPSSRLRLMADLHWINWSVWEETVMEFDRDIQLLMLAASISPGVEKDRMALALNLKDTWHPSFGIEFQASDRLSLRLGYEARSTSVPVEYFGLIPFPDLTIYSAGIGWKLGENSGIDLSFSFLDTETFKLPNNTSRNFNYTGIGNFIYNPFAGLDFEQDLTAHILSINFNFSW